MSNVPSGTGWRRCSPARSPAAMRVRELAGHATSGRSRTPRRRARASRGSSRCRSRNRGCARAPAVPPARASNGRSEPAEPSEPEVRSLGAVGEFEQAIHAAGEADRACYHTPDMRFRGLAEATAVVLAGVALTSVLTYPLAFRDRSRRARQHRRRAVEHLGGVVGRARADVGSRRRLPGQHLLSAAQRARLLRGQSRARARSARRSGRLTKNPYTTHNVAVLASFVMSRSRRVLSRRGILTGSRQAAARRRRAVRVLPVHLRADGAHPAAVDRAASRSACSRFTGSSIAPTCVARAGARPRAVGAGAVLRLLRHLRGADGGPRHADRRRRRRGRWRDRRYWVGIALAAFVALALTVPFFLPYLSVQQDTGFARTLDDARMYSAISARGWPRRPGRTAGGCRGSGRSTRCLFPGIVTSGSGAGAGCVHRRQRDAAVRATNLVPAVYGLTARARVLALVRPRRRALQRCSIGPSRSSLPPGAGPHGHLRRPCAWRCSPAVAVRAWLTRTRRDRDRGPALLRRWRRPS